MNVTPSYIMASMFFFFYFLFFFLTAGLRNTFFKPTWQSNIINGTKKEKDKRGLKRGRIYPLHSFVLLK